MKPRSLLPSVAPLPTITETHEDISQSLDEYLNSIKELAQPGCGPLRITRTQRPRLFSKPLGKHSSSGSMPRSASRALQPRRGSLGLDEITLKFSSQKNYGAKDPLDWLFAQTQLQSHAEDLQRTENTPAALWLFWSEEPLSENTEAQCELYERSHELN